MRKRGGAATGRARAVPPATPSDAAKPPRKGVAPALQPGRDTVRVHWLPQAVLLTATVASLVATYFLARLLAKEGSAVNYLLGAIPLFLVMVVLEMALLAAEAVGSAGNGYELPDTVSSIGAGIVMQLVSAHGLPLVARAVVPFLAYTSVWSRFGTDVALFREATPASLALTLLAVDLGYYWFHRASHEVHFMWAGHSVHHSSDHYNLGTALRQSWLQNVFSPIFQLPLALVVPPPLHVTCRSWNTIYQFWIHTCIIRRLGPLEWVLMTPSHHRVHHDRRVHKNFGGILIIWDRLFGTFLDELDSSHTPTPTPTTATTAAAGEENCMFGTRSRVASWSEGGLQAHFPLAMLASMRSGFRRGGVGGLLKALVRGPGWHSSTAKRVLVNEGQTVKRIRRRQARFTAPQWGYHVAHFLATLALALITLLAGPRLRVWVVPVCLSVALQGMALDGRPASSFLAETARCLGLALCCFVLDPSPFPAANPTLRLAATVFYATSAVSALLARDLTRGLTIEAA